jgi:hypothetical protein
VQLRTILTIGLTLALGMTTTIASAEESLFKTGPKGPIFASVSGAATAANARPPIFGVPSSAAAAQGAAATTSTVNDHMFGVGLRLGGFAGGIEGNGIGGSVRYFFNGGPLGVQGEISRYGLDLSGVDDWSGVQFSPAVIYRFIEQKFNAPLSLTPYAGAGLSFIHSDLGRR